MSLIDFIKEFSDEQSCKDKWKEHLEKVGVSCCNCGSKVYYWKSDKDCFDCKQCGYRQTLRINTVMNGSQLPFRYWFYRDATIDLNKEEFFGKSATGTVGTSKIQSYLGNVA